MSVPEILHRKPDKYTRKHHTTVQNSVVQPLGGPALGRIGDGKNSPQARHIAGERCSKAGGVEESANKERNAEGRRKGVWGGWFVQKIV